ncbi:hypothetical protein ACQ4PT_037561 [Festuca glaucescens]
MGSSSMWMTLLLPALLVVAMSAETLTVKPGCVDRCGNVSIPYPFGIGKDCFREGFEISCGSDSVPVLVGTGHTGAKPVLVTAPRGPGDATGGVYRISRNLNELVVLGCNTLGLLASGCLTRSTRHAWPSSMTSAPCRKAHAGASAAAGCSVDLPMGLTNNLVKMAPVGSGQLDVCPCDYAFIVDKGHYNFSKADLHMNGSQTSMPLSLDWAIRDNGKTCADAATQPGYACKSVHSECVNTNNGPGYTCNCTKGYEGNPCDVDNGCTDIDECARPADYSCHGTCKNIDDGHYKCDCRPGYNSKDPYTESCTPKFPLPAQISIGVIGGILLLAFLSFIIIIRKERRMRQELYRRNGGPILEKASIVKLFKKEDLTQF